MIWVPFDYFQSQRIVSMPLPYFKSHEIASRAKSPLPCFFRLETGKKAWQNVWPYVETVIITFIVTVVQKAAV